MKDRKYSEGLETSPPDSGRATRKGSPERMAAGSYKQKAPGALLSPLWEMAFLGLTNLPMMPAPKDHFLINSRHKIPVTVDTQLFHYS